MVIFLSFKYLIWPNGLISWMNLCTGRKHTPALDFTPALRMKRGAQNPPLQFPFYFQLPWNTRINHLHRILLVMWSPPHSPDSEVTFQFPIRKLLHTHSFLSKDCWYLGKRMFKWQMKLKTDLWRHQETLFAEVSVYTSRVVEPVPMCPQRVSVCIPEQRACFLSLPEGTRGTCVGCPI